MQRWEFNAVVLEVIILGSAAIGIASGFAARAGLPDYIAFGLFFAVLGIVQIPILSVLARMRGGTLEVGRWLTTIVATAVLAAAVFRLVPH